MDNNGNVQMNYCSGCMKPLQPGQTICPACGYDNSVRHNNEDLLPEGTLLRGRYLVGRVIGRGGFGVTYLGLDINENVRLAIKEYFPAEVGVRDYVTYDVLPKSGDPADFDYGKKSFYNEADSLSHFNSPNIVRVRAFFQDHGTAYIVMDFVDGNNLTAEINRNGGRLPWQRVLNLMKPLVLALDIVHKENLIHRDIKPDNLSVVKDGDGEHLVLLDFGSARSFASNQSKHFTAMITQGYAPIEQYSQVSNQGPYTDIYSLCGTIYAAITGKKPPSATERLEREKKVPPFSEYGIEVPEYVEKAIMHGLEFRSAARPQTMFEFFKELYPEADNSDWVKASYEAAKRNMLAGTQEGYQRAYDLLIQIPGYRSSDKLTALCCEKLGIPVPTPAPVQPKPPTPVIPPSYDPNQRKDEIYNTAVEKAAAEDYPGYMDAVRLLKRIPGWKDADDLIVRYEQIIASKNKDYEQVKSDLEKGDSRSLEEAWTILGRLKGWLDADNMVEECRDKLSSAFSAGGSGSDDIFGVRPAVRENNNDTPSGVPGAFGPDPERTGTAVKIKGAVNSAAEESRTIAVPDGEIGIRTAAAESAEKDKPAEPVKKDDTKNPAASGDDGGAIDPGGTGKKGGKGWIWIVILILAVICALVYYFYIYKG